jgi:hypothetical protein
MRLLAILCCLCTLFMIGAPAAAASSFDALSLAASPAGVFAAEDVKIDLPKVDIDVDTKEERAWYKNPLIVGLGVVILVLLVALVGRGGTTIIDRRH